MKRGSVSLELDLDFEFSDDGNDVQLIGIRCGDDPLPEKLALRLMGAMSRQWQQSLTDDAWANADEVDDAHDVDEEVA